MYTMLYGTFTQTRPCRHQGLRNRPTALRVGSIRLRPATGDRRGRCFIPSRRILFRGIPPHSSISPRSAEKRIADFAPKRPSPCRTCQSTLNSNPPHAAAPTTSRRGLTWGRWSNSKPQPATHAFALRRECRYADLCNYYGYRTSTRPSGGGRIQCTPTPSASGSSR